jgi:LIVCS family branched-chain amino acid:cation transporter
VVTAAISLIDGAALIGLPVESITEVYGKLPLYKEGIGWLLPAIAGALLGYLWGSLRPKPKGEQKAYQEKPSNT